VTHYDVAKQRITDSGIWIVNADGTGNHQLALPDGIPYGDADWSPDGSRIVFSSWPIRDFNDRRANVFTVRPDGSDLRPLTDSRCGGCGAPSWTPDGAHILFWSSNRFWLMEPDGSGQQPIDAVKLTFGGDAQGYADYGFIQPTP
jgi:Tol biopolymer transport system component